MLFIEAQWYGKRAERWRLNEQNEAFRVKWKESWPAFRAHLYPMYTCPDLASGRQLCRFGEKCETSGRQ